MDLSKFQQNGQFLMLALDHRGSFKKLMNPSKPDAVTDEQVIELKSEIIQALRDQFSGLLIDEVWGLEAYQKRTKPFLLPLEKSFHTGMTELEYSVAQIKDMGASGAKLLIDFDPDSIGVDPRSQNSSHQLEIAKKVMDDCKQADFPFFLEIVTYTPGVSIQIHPGGGHANLVIESVKRFIQEGVVPDVWKLEYPGTPGKCQELTKMVRETPWILLTGGQTFEEFKPKLEVASQNGCQGFLAGRALWQEVCTLQGEEKEKFLKETLSERFKIISEIVTM